MIRRRTGWLALGGMLAALALGGCSQAPGMDDSFTERIPAALERSDLGVTESWADKGVDGLTTYLSVGVSLDRDVISASELQQLIAIVVDENTVSVRNLRLSVEDEAGEDIDIVPLLEQLGADPLVGTFVSITFDEATAIAEGAAS
ncbi:hypothetical protein [Microbacterium caowuchunii]|uniref:Uncharacterized protein n=1 Tax=Microbacterium caowuchunii TaxID=2614638 RepID=A0A5N0TR52_9MICO|nr:hypothetical protein [Microbacterium caowuchunii]KAA9135819.1 hypothetical protein F6B40_01130 [Microbacterium caowuchunii]